jgi:hypothetical protein
MMKKLFADESKSISPTLIDYLSCMSACGTTLKQNLQPKGKYFMQNVVSLLSWQNDTSTTKLRTSATAILQTIKTSKDLQLSVVVSVTLI